MSIEVSYQEKLGCLIVKVSGQWNRDSVIQQIEAVRAAAEKHGQTRLLIDIRQLSRPTRELDRFYVGEHVAQHWRGLKVAVLSRSEITTRFAEDTAVNRGAHLAVFIDQDTALEWLTPQEKPGC